MDVWSDRDFKIPLIFLKSPKIPQKSISLTEASIGLGPAAVGSAPNAALFFCTYDTAKRMGVRWGWQDGDSSRIDMMKIKMMMMMMIMRKILLMMM